MYHIKRNMQILKNFSIRFFFPGFYNTGKLSETNNDFLYFGLVGHEDKFIAKYKKKS